MVFSKAERFKGVLCWGEKQLRGEFDFAETNKRSSNYLAGRNFPSEELAVVIL